MFDIKPNALGDFFTLGQSFNRVLDLIQTRSTLFGWATILQPDTQKPHDNSIIILKECGLKFTFDSLT